MEEAWVRFFRPHTFLDISRSTLVFGILAPYIGVEVMAQKQDSFSNEFIVLEHCRVNPKLNTESSVSPLPFSVESLTRGVYYEKLLNSFGEIDLLCVISTK